MAKITSLEDFLKSYMKSSAIENSPMSYETFKSQSGSTHESDYLRAMTKATLTHRSAAPTHGTGAERLAAEGLGSGGYSQYLSEKNKLELDSQATELRDERDAGEMKLARDYVSYLDSYSKKQESLARDITARLVEQNLTDTGTAYSYALNAGLTPERARKVSGDVYSLVRQKLISQIIDKVASMHLDAEGAMLYASHMGLNSRDTEMIGSSAEEMIKHYEELTKDYLDYLEDESDRTSGDIITLN